MSAVLASLREQRPLAYACIGEVKLDQLLPLYRGEVLTLLQEVQDHLAAFNSVAADLNSKTFATNPRSNYEVRVAETTTNVEEY